MQTNHNHQILAFLKRFCLVLLLSSTGAGAATSSTSPGLPMACPTINKDLAVTGSTYCNYITGAILPTDKITIKNSQVGILYQV
jgi:hypothetical protein